jgi:hypothetical protein
MLQVHAAANRKGGRFANDYIKTSRWTENAKTCKSRFHFPREKGIIFPTPKKQLEIQDHEKAVDGVCGPLFGFRPARGTRLLCCALRMGAGPDPDVV